MVDGNKSRVPTFAQIRARILQPHALWGGRTNFAPFRDSLNQVAHLGSAQKQCMSNACKYFTLLCSGMYCEGCKFYVHSVQCSMQLLWSQRLFLSAEEIFFLKATSHWLSWNTKVYVCLVCHSLPRAEQILFWVSLPAVGRVQLRGPEIIAVRAKS